MRRGAGLIIAMSLAAAGPALAAVSRPAFTPPRMIASPSADELARRYPIDAARKEASGRVILGCVLGTDGLLRDCTVVSETPPGLGFGEAALKVAPSFRFSPAARGGKAVELPSLRLPISFRLEPGAVADIPPPAVQARPLPRAPSSALVDGFLQFLLPLIFIGIALLRYPKARQWAMRAISWSWRRAQEAIERSQTPGEELSAPPSHDPRTDVRIDPRPPSPSQPFPQPPASGGIVEEVGKGVRRPAQDAGIVSDADGWSLFGKRK